MKEYIFSLGLIPVQEFISEARRSRGLRAGSQYILVNEQGAIATINRPWTQLIIHTQLSERFKNQSFEGIINNAEYSLPNRASGYCGEIAAKIFDSLQIEYLEKEWEDLFKKAFNNQSLRKIGMDSESEKAIQESFNLLGTSKCPIRLVWVLKKTPEQQTDALPFRTDPKS